MLENHSKPSITNFFFKNLHLYVYSKHIFLLNIIMLNYKILLEFKILIFSEVFFKFKQTFI